MTNTASTMTDIFRILGVTTDFKPDVSAIHNQGGLLKNKIVHSVHRFFDQNMNARTQLKSVLTKCFIDAAQTLNRRNPQTAPALEPQVPTEINDLYREDIMKLQDLIERDLSHWLE